ncbi:MAG TPA: CHAT domain-containing tetratricopeptide repeat protein [Candidatus Angelobacter sp.]
MSRLCAIFLVAGVFPALFAQTPASPALAAPQTAASEPVPLEFGKTIEGELSAGQRQSYQFALAEGQYVRVEVREIGVEVGIVLYLPEGEVIPWGEPMGSPLRTKSVKAVAKIAGAYRIEVYAGTRAAPGRYEIRIAALRPATDDDRALEQARGLFTQGHRLIESARWAEGIPLMVQCLEIRERVLGPNDPLVGLTLAFVASAYSVSGDYAKAEPLYLRALKNEEETLGPDNPDLIVDLVGIALLYRDKGDTLKEEEFLRRGLAILEKANQVETAAGARLLQDLGTWSYDRGDYALAADYFEHARKVWEKLLGPDHFHLAHSYSLSGRVAYDAGDYVKAAAMFQKALSLAQKGLGLESLSLTPYLNDMAMLDCTTGDYTKGEALYRQVLSRHEQSGAMSHPVVQDTLYGLARCLAADGNPSEAVVLQSRASDIEERVVALNLAVGSEREKQAFHDSRYWRSLRNISLHAQLAPADPAALRLAVTTVLRQKGRVQDAMSTSFTRLRQRFGPDGQRQVDELNDATSRLAKLVLNGPQKQPAPEYQQQISTLEAQREELESKITVLTAGFYEVSKAATLERIQAAVPEDAALIEFAVYRSFDPKAPDNQSAYGKRRYIAYVIHHQGGVGFQELGDAAAIDQALGKLREALRDPQRKDARQIARAVDRKVLEPIRALAGNATHLIVSPDGELNLIPFEALVDEQNHFIVERYSISYLTTGRDLLRMQVTRNSKSNPLVLANPLFDEGPVVRTARPVYASVRTSATMTARRSVTGGENLAGVYFAPLTGTAQEARAIQGLFPGARVLTGAAASKSALQQTDAPLLLHIATHGFFLNDLPGGASRDPLNVTTATSHIGAAANPLLRSGLALSGANLIKKGDEKGILTALEASSLNLWGTKLVTLSACDTGIGEIKNGEGVYGLRRAFFESGAETLVMSLWPVSDRVTREMMTAYYAGLKRGLGRGEALRQAELAMMKRKDRQHPFYWASFIQSGEWANLDGQR